MDAGAPRLPATRGLTAHYFFTFECAPGTAALLCGGELLRLGLSCEHRQAVQDVPAPAAPLLQAWRSCQCKSRPQTLSVRLAHPAPVAPQTAGWAWRSVQQRVLHEGDTGGASWSAWLLCSLSREPGTPERRVVQLDVKRRRLVVLCKATVKHTFQARRAPALRRPGTGTLWSTLRGAPDTPRAQVAEVCATRLSADSAALVFLSFTGKREVAFLFQTAHDAGLFVCARPARLAQRSLRCCCLAKSLVGLVVRPGPPCAGVRRRSALTQVRAGEYLGVAYPHNVIRRGALQLRGSSGVFFERYAVRRPPAAVAHGGRRVAALKPACAGGRPAEAVPHVRPECGLPRACSVPGRGAAVL
jgi:hypothetical protein